MRVKFYFWGTDEIDIKEEVVKLRIPLFARKVVKEAYVQHEWSKWAYTHFGDDLAHGSWRKKTKRRW